MIKVSMPAFVHTHIRPPEKLIITGLGVVGLFAAQLGQLYGYDVIACDPNIIRCKIAKEHGIKNVVKSFSEINPNFKKQIGLALECSGNEKAILEICNWLKVRGEIFLVGVPWKPSTDITAQKLLHSVFYNYIILQSGWEGEMPPDPEIHSSSYHLKSALEWIKKRKIKIKKTAYKIVSPEKCQEYYQNLLYRRLKELTVIFDWRKF